MLTLYVKTGCPFCAKVLAAGEEFGVTFDLKNVADDGVAEELVALGGKKQEPYLVDSETGISMYEANLIVHYLRDHYGSENAGHAESAGNGEGASAADAPSENPQVCEA